MLGFKVRMCASNMESFVLRSGVFNNRLDQNSAHGAVNVKVNLDVNPVQTQGPGTTDLARSNFLFFPHIVQVSSSFRSDKLYSSEGQRELVGCQLLHHVDQEIFPITESERRPLREMGRHPIPAFLELRLLEEEPKIRVNLVRIE